MQKDTSSLEQLSQFQKSVSGSSDSGDTAGTVSKARSKKRTNAFVVVGLVLVGLVVSGLFFFMVLLELESCCGVAGKALSF